MAEFKMKLTLPTEVQTPTCPVIADTSVLKTIGNTPLIKIKNIGKEYEGVTIYAKAEWKNAGGSRFQLADEPRKFYDFNF